jgi:hypothetical protein
MQHLTIVSPARRQFFFLSFSLSLLREQRDPFLTDPVETMLLAPRREL